MARLSSEQADKYSGSGGNWFKLANDKDTALVQFPYTSKEDIIIESVHEVPLEGKSYGYKVSCLRTPEDSVDVCPMCAAGYTATATGAIQLYNHTTGQFEFWERSKKWIEQKIHFLMDTYTTEGFDYRVFQVQRLGAKGDTQTKYEFALMDRYDPISWEDIEIEDPVGTVIRMAGYDAMCDFIETGKWPPEDTTQTAAPPVRRPPAPQHAAPAPRRPAPAARPAPANRPTAAPPAASARRAPTAQSAPRGGSRTSRASQGGGEEQF